MAQRSEDIIHGGVLNIGDVVRRRTLKCITQQVERGLIERGDLDILPADDMYDRVLIPTHREWQDTYYRTHEHSTTREK